MQTQTLHRQDMIVLLCIVLSYTRMCFLQSNAMRRISFPLFFFILSYARMRSMCVCCLRFSACLSVAIALVLWHIVSPRDPKLYQFGAAYLFT